MTTSPTGMCRNCYRTELTYDLDKEIYTCDSCGTKYKAHMIYKSTEEHWVEHWLGEEIK